MSKRMALPRVVLSKSANVSGRMYRIMRAIARTAMRAINIWRRVLGNVVGIKLLKWLIIFSILGDVPFIY